MSIEKWAAAEGVGSYRKRNEKKPVGSIRPDGLGLGGDVAGQMVFTLSWSCTSRR